MENNAAFLGRGWSFPPDFYCNGAEVEMVSGEEDILQSLHILLSTSVNERTMFLSFGCDLNMFLFEEIDYELLNSIKGMVSDAILMHEPRIKVNDVLVSTGIEESGLLLITIDYTIRATNNRYNMVYPYYIKEASDMPMLKR